MTGTQQRKCSLAYHEVADEDLLHRFVDHNDQPAFDELVRRYGSLVMGLCRRVLQHEQDTEDAFQATFLVLARKASSIRKHQSLGSWLYKVAYRIALRARSARGQQPKQNMSVAADASSHDVEVNKRDLASLVDEEVQRLPEKYRTPVLLCYLQGHTNEEAARQMQCPTGTVKIRLLRAREILRKRLVRRGVGVSIAVVLHAWAAPARAAVSASLQAATVQVCVGSGTGTSLSATFLVECWLKGLAMAKMKLAVAVLILVGLIFGADHLLQRAWALDTYLPGRKIPATRQHQGVPMSPSGDVGREYVLGESPVGDGENSF